VQAEKLAITRRIAGDIKDIWSLQPRFESRAGYDFLLLRAESGEIDQELADWWTRFQHVDGEERAAMLVPEQAGERKRRRRRRKPAADGGVDLSPAE